VPAIHLKSVARDAVRTWFFSGLFALVGVGAGVGAWSFFARAEWGMAAILSVVASTYLAAILRLHWLRHQVLVGRL